jgi:pilus assembly protein Flp/PilA
MTKPLTAASTKFARDEEGASLVEYGLLLSLVAVVCIAAVTTLGTSISDMLTKLAGVI